MTIATATYQDIYYGKLTMQLEAFKTTHHGKPATKYRWVASGGQPVTSGWRPSLSAAYMVAVAKRDHRFSNVDHMRDLPGSLPAAMRDPDHY